MRTLGALVVVAVMPSLAMAEDAADTSSLDALLAAASSSFAESEPVETAEEAADAEAEVAVEVEGLRARWAARRAARRAARHAPAL